MCFSCPHSLSVAFVVVVVVVVVVVEVVFVVVVVVVVTTTNEWRKREIYIERELITVFRIFQSHHLDIKLGSIAL